MISPAMSTFQYPPSSSMIPQYTSSTSRAETILDHVPSSSSTASFKAGSAVFRESKHPRIACRADTIGVKTVEGSTGDGSGVDQDGLEGRNTVGGAELALFWDIILGRQFRDFDEGLVNSRKQDTGALLPVLGFLCKQTRN